MLYTFIPGPAPSPEFEKPTKQGEKNEGKRGGNTNAEDNEANACEQASYGLVGDAKEDD